MTPFKKKNVNHLHTFFTRPPTRKLVSSKCASLETVQLHLEFFTSFFATRYGDIYGDLPCISSSGKFVQGSNIFQEETNRRSPSLAECPSSSPLRGK